MAELAEEAGQWWWVVDGVHLGAPVGLPLRPPRAALEAAMHRAQADVALLSAGAMVGRALGAAA